MEHVLQPFIDTFNRQNIKICLINIISLPLCFVRKVGRQGNDIGDEDGGRSRDENGKGKEDGEAVRGTVRGRRNGKMKGKGKWKRDGENEEGMGRT
jgi:hypothetical protein